MGDDYTRSEMREINEECRGGDESKKEDVRKGEKCKGEVQVRREMRSDRKRRGKGKR